MTFLQRTAAASLAGAGDGESGFRLLLGPSGLEARLALIREATHSLDLQYYLLHDDLTGRLVLRELRDAALRGVRVRLLLDDLYTEGLVPLLNGLGAFPNVEIRLYNPFPTRGGVGKRFLSALPDFQRLQRRMHNKLLVADGAMAIVGGRNLGDEYFNLNETSNFFDLDACVAGPVVGQLSSLFDEYWNSEQVRTAESLLHEPGAPLTRRARFDALVSRAQMPEAAQFKGLDQVGQRPMIEELHEGRLRLHFGTAQAFADSPAKSQGTLTVSQLPSGALLGSTRLLIAKENSSAKSDLSIATPYMIPDHSGLAFIRETLERGVKIVLLTNSLAATDEPVVHTGYRRYRDNLLRAGVEIFEVHPNLGQELLTSGEAKQTTMRLHAKVAIIDRERLMVGSANFDPRSAELNTEIVVLIRSKGLALQMQSLFDATSRDASYQVRLRTGSERDLEWVRFRDGVLTEVIETEPGADPLTRIKLYIQSLLVWEELL